MQQPVWSVSVARLNARLIVAPIRKKKCNKCKYGEIAAILFISLWKRAVNIHFVDSLGRNVPGHLTKSRRQALLCWFIKSHNFPNYMLLNLWLQWIRFCLNWLLQVGQAERSFVILKLSFIIYHANILRRELRKAISIVFVDHLVKISL